MPDKEKSTMMEQIDKQAILNKTLYNEKVPGK